MSPTSIFGYSTGHRWVNRHLDDMVNLSMKQGVKGRVKVRKQLDPGLLQTMKFEITFGYPIVIAPSRPKRSKRQHDCPFNHQSLRNFSPPSTSQ
jgi:hypothetical protein